ncbi:MAG: metal-dependent transcriptional regulator [Syntrophaceae bacterium]|nr:metal-dependent transcriptional regulator [Syntrophaceae bacterium]
MLSQKAEEILELLWVMTQEESGQAVQLKNEECSPGNPEIEELLKLGFVKYEGEKLILKGEGLREAESVVRRHRLAERLMADVLDIQETLLEKNACQFEHLLLEEVEESVCTLLGHPRECPHGKPIPIGPCCKRTALEVKSVVLPLCELSPGDMGRVAYLRTGNAQRLQKLLTLGILPGIEVEMVQRFPSFVFRIGHSQMAVDREMAEGIHVRLTGEKHKQ